MRECQKLPKDYWIKVFGCRSNQFDAEAIETLLAQNGWKFKPESQAHTIIVVGCSVTEKAHKEVLRTLRQLRRRYPQKTLVLTGCSAELAHPGNADILVPMKDRSSLPAYLEKKEACPQEDFFFVPILRMRGKSRVFVKIQEGCNYHCNYCIIPQFRGMSRSLPLHKVIHQIRTIYEAGRYEIVFTGTQLAGWGSDLTPRCSLLDLLERVDSLSLDFRWRLSSIEPWALTKDLVDFIAESQKGTPFLHLPIQTGSQKLLAKMRRPGRLDRLAELLAYTRQKIPKIRLGTDIIVGHPEEKEAYFQETLAYLEKVGFSYHHIFPFSERPNQNIQKTPLPPEVLRERLGVLRQLDNQCRHRDRENRIGDVGKALVCSPWEGISEHNYILQFPEAFQGKGPWRHYQIISKGKTKLMAKDHPKGGMYGRS